MANDKINEYVVEATSFLDGSYFDIDQLVAPATWQSQKVPFSAMIAQFGNIYNYDGTIIEQRTLDGNLKTKGLFFIELQTFVVRAAALEYESDVDIKLIAGATGALILPSDLDPALNVVTPEEFMIKGNTTSKDLMVYVNGSWENVAFTSDLISIYNSDGTITSPRTIDANGNPLTFDNISNFYLENVGQVAFNDTANIAFFIQLGGLTSFNFGASSSFNASLNIGTDVFPSSTRGSVTLTQGRGITVPSLTTVVEAALPIIVNRESLFLHNSDLNRFRGYDGTIYQSFAYLTDIITPPLTDVLTAGFTTADGQVIKALNGGAQLDLRSLGQDNLWSLTSDNGGFNESFISGHATIFQGGWATVGAGNIFEANAVKVRMKMDPAVADFVTLDSCEIVIKNTQFATDTNPFKIVNTSGAILSPISTAGTKALLGNNAALTTTANVAKSGAFGVTGGDIKSDNTFYFTNIGFIETGDVFEGTIKRVTITNVDKVYTLPNRDVDFASTSGVQESTTVTSSTGAGAVGITGGRHEVNMTAIGNALTLANGSIGQRLNVVCVSELLGPDTAILTPTTLLGSATTITFGGVGDCISLEYGTGGWAVISAQGATCA